MNKRYPGDLSDFQWSKLECFFDTKRRRKRHIITDTMGLLPAVVVHAANIHGSKSGERVKSVYGWFISIVLGSDKSTRGALSPVPRRAG